jgi:hypothetical protein
VGAGVFMVAVGVAAVYWYGCAGVGYGAGVDVGFGGCV